VCSYSGSDTRVCLCQEDDAEARVRGAALALAKLTRVNSRLTL